ncbi:MAG: hypothetical protein PHH09_13540 [Methanoregulaceae archaeon]|nr:hypothetical protein [Methanoregulaceae archaeon]
MDIPTAVMEQLWALLLVVIAAIIAYLEKRDKDDAIKENEQVAAFYDPQTGNTTVPATVPERAWKMNDETKKFLISGETEQDAQRLLAQIDVAEAEGKTDYFITYSKGWYHINFGLIMGSARGG